MTLTEVLLLLVIAAVCGGLGRSLVGYTTGGCLASIFVGIVGAFIGVWLARELGLPILLAIQVGGQAFPVIWSVIGSALLTVILGLVDKYLRKP
ncbi:MAG: hypothetical protein AAGA75_18030 [Cyanobacteria bacterium P01_E01_bin.6]